MFVLRKEFSFEAAHFLPKVANGHKCKNTHGHSYRIAFEVGCEDLVDGMVVDYKAISSCAKPIVKLFDHQLINDFVPNPTAENIAYYCSNAFIRKFKEDHPTDLHRNIILRAVEVSETMKTNCRLEVNASL